MRPPRVSIAFLAACLGVIALDMAVIRSLFRPRPGSNQTLFLVPLDGTHSIPFATLALGVLPMASLLVLGAAYHVPKFRRTGTLPGSWVGFESFGWFSVFMFMAVSSLAPSAVQGYLRTALPPVLAPVLWALGTGEPAWLVDRVMFAMCGFLLVLPELLFAAAGGRALRRSEVRLMASRAARTAPRPQSAAVPDEVEERPG